MTTTSAPNELPPSEPVFAGGPEPRRWWVIGDSGNVAGFIAAFAIVVVTSSNNGSYFSTSWGWLAMAFLGIAVTGLVFMVSVRVDVLQTLFFAAVTAFVVWVGVSALWSESVPGSIREVERDIVYVGLSLTLAVFGRYLAATGMVVGLLAGITVMSGYALATRLFPTHVGPPDPTFGYRLSVPLGYWNAMGLFAAMGLIVAVGVAAHSTSRTLRMGAGAAACVVVPTLLFTFSRGGFAAAGIGFVALAVLDTRRIALAVTALLLALPLAALLWLGENSRPLTEPNSSPAAAAAAGREYAIWLVVLVLVAAALVEVAHGLARSLASRPSAARWFGRSVVGIVALIVAGIVFAYGGPVTAYERGLAAFRVESVATGLQRDRLFTLSNSGRLDHWRVALDEFRERPVLGSGAGTFEQTWYRERRINLDVRDAHNLYVEVLGELGVTGLLLLLGALCIPIIGFLRSRSGPLVPAAAGLYVAFLAHAAIDWDWEVVALTAIAILAGSVGLIAEPASLDRFVVGRPLRLAVAAAAAACILFAFVSFVGNRDVAKSQGAAVNGNPLEALRSARAAHRALPWSIEPWLALGEAQRAIGDRGGARRSFERAVSADPGNWRAWLVLAEVAEGDQRRIALGTAKRLNPRGLRDTLN